MSTLLLVPIITAIGACIIWRDELRAWVLATFVDTDVPTIEVEHRPQGNVDVILTERELKALPTAKAEHDQRISQRRLAERTREATDHIGRGWGTGTGRRITDHSKRAS